GDSQWNTGMSAFVINPYAFGAANITDFAFVASTTNNDNASTYTFTAASIGAADSNRRVVVAFGARAGSNTAFSISSATIGGTSATILVQKDATDDGGNKDMAALLIADVPTGTTADVVVNMSRSGVRAAMATYRIVSTSALTVIDTADGSGSASVNMSLDVQPSSVALAVGASRYFDATGHTYSGIATRDANVSVESNAAWFSCASEQPTTTATNTITVTNNTYWLTTVAASLK
ncbi:MAG: hypothetical protein VKK63_12215, partial [Synechococcus sp.]|nr:hypothetical protein [Synechococcus sp.]